jgi:1,4-alpha-glucan branching enzyme
VAVNCNFSGVPVYSYALDLPAAGVWHEILNTDAQEYGGSGVGNMGVVRADESGRATMVLPPLGVLWLRHDPDAHIPSPTRG